MRFNPIRILPQVVGDVGMNNGHILVTGEGGRSADLQVGNGQVDHVRGQVAGVGSAADGALEGALVSRRSRVRSAADGDLVGKQDIGRGLQHVADQDVVGLAARSAQFLNRARDHIVQRVEFQQVSNSDIFAVLGQAHVDAGHAQLLAGGDHAFGQGRSQRKGVPFTPLDGPSVSCGQALLPAQLCKDQLVAVVLQQFGVVEGLHGGSQVIRSAEGCRAPGVSIDVVACRVHQRTGISEQVQDHFPQFLHRVSLLFFSRDKEGVSF